MQKELWKSKGILAGAGMIVFGLLGYALGFMQDVEAVQRVLEGLGIIGIRHAIE